MTSIAMREVFGVAGAGTMGTGIAILAARAGHRVFLYDSNEQALTGPNNRIERFLDANVQKGRMKAAEAKEISRRIRPAFDPKDFAECDFVFEAIAENLEAKRTLFKRIEHAVRKNTPIATNTSSLSIASLAAACDGPDRFLGAHFFNPAQVLPLVEVVPGVRTSAQVTEAVLSILKRIGKTPIIAKDTPGFVVNRIARPFYGEALRIVEEGIADVPTVDWAMKKIGGFRMGPFELMDFIGNDVNLTVTRTLFEGFFFDPRYRPSLLQQRMVEANLLGQKTGRGFYDYSEGAGRPSPQENDALGSLIWFRILSMLVNEAADAVYLGVVTPQAADLAMVSGVNYPKGLLAWANELGPERILRQLEDLGDTYREDRYRPSPLLRKLVKENRMFPVHG